MRKLLPSGTGDMEITTRMRSHAGPVTPLRSIQPPSRRNWTVYRGVQLHAVTDANGRPLSFFMTAGQISDYTGAAALLDDLPKAKWLLGDRGYDADWFREALQAKGIKPCIPGRKSRLQPVKYDKRRYRRRNRIEIMFGRLKDWRRVATRYDRCPQVFFSAIALAATIIFWL